MDGRGKTKKYTDEELIEWIKQFDSRSDMRNDNIYKYYAARKRNMQSHFPNKITKQQITNEELIVWIKQFNTITEMRAENKNKYILCTKRGLREHFPPKLTKAGNKVGSSAEMNKLLKEERKLAREAKKVLKQEKKVKYEKLDSTVASKMYKGEILEGGNIICGRCFEESNKPSRHNKYMCNSCYNKYMSLKNNGKDHNKWNVRDEYCNTIIRHHEKTFEIGIIVDERTEKYLSMIGYDFIFKEIYDK